MLLHVLHLTGKAAAWDKGVCITGTCRQHRILLTHTHRNKDDPTNNSSCCVPTPPPPAETTELCFAQIRSAPTPTTSAAQTAGTAQGKPQPIAVCQQQHTASSETSKLSKNPSPHRIAAHQLTSHGFILFFLSRFPPTFSTRLDGWTPCGSRGKHPFKSETTQEQQLAGRLKSSSNFRHRTIMFRRAEKAVLSAGIRATPPAPKAPSKRAGAPSTAATPTRAASEGPEHLQPLQDHRGPPTSHLQSAWLCSWLWLAALAFHQQLLALCC